MHQVLKAAAELKTNGQRDEARNKVRSEAVALWLRLAPEVRSAMLRYQSIVATRNDLGSLASMHNKFVWLALIRLRLSMKEYLNPLPSDTENLFKQVTLPDPQAKARLFVPTRPSLLSKNERIRLTIVCTGTGKVQLHTRVRGSMEWVKTPAKLLARKTHEATLGPFQTGAAFVEYFVSCGDQNSPTYIVTLV